MERKIGFSGTLERKSSFAGISNLNNFGSFCGYASIFNVIDSCRDIILPGAFRNTLFSKTSSDIKLLWQHLQTSPIGCLNLIREDSVGLYVEGKIMLDLRQGLEAYNLIKTKAVTGLSIGYTVKKSDADQKINARIIKEIDLFEISIVTFPANTLANITYCKGKTLEQTIAEKIAMLEEYMRG